MKYQIFEESASGIFDRPGEIVEHNKVPAIPIDEVPVVNLDDLLRYMTWKTSVDGIRRAAKLIP